MLAAVYDLEQLGIRTEAPARTYLMGVIDAVERHGLTAYAAEYLVLAEAAEADLVTADRLLASAAGERALYVGGKSRLAKSATTDDAHADQREPDWASWPGAADYLDDLRQEVLADVEAMKT